MGRVRTEAQPLLSLRERRTIHRPSASGRHAAPQRRIPALEAVLEDEVLHVLKRPVQGAALGGEGPGGGVDRHRRPGVADPAAVGAVVAWPSFHCRNVRSRRPGGEREEGEAFHGLKLYRDGRRAATIV